MINLRETKEGLQVDIYVQPGAKTTGIIGEHGGRLKISVSQPPENGKANDAVIDLLSKNFNIPISSITILRGHTSRQKTVLLAGKESDVVARMLSS
jgi:uncharacterized protein